MPKKANPRAGVKIEINDDLSIIINHQGDVLHDPGYDAEAPEVPTLQLNAQELDRLAELSSAVVKFDAAYDKLEKGIRDVTRNGSNEICTADTRYEGGDVIIGCQCIHAQDIARVHKVSLAMRKKHGAKK